MKKFLFFFTATFLSCGLVLSFGTYYKKIYRHYFGYYPYLEEYQIKKIETSSDYDTVFLGDSSLGNAVDTATFDAVCGTRSLNLALTGIYGFYGDINYLERVLQNNPIRNVIIVHTLDTLGRAPDMRAYLATSPFIVDKESLLRGLRKSLSDKRYSIFHNILLLKTLVLEMLNFKDSIRGYLMLLGNDSFVQGDNVIVNDYHRQGHSLFDTTPLKFYASKAISPSINPEQTDLLDALARICLERKLNCIYAFGPLLNKLLDNSEPMIEASSLRIKVAGLSVVKDTPVGIPYEEIGDSIDHVAPKAKEKFTRIYANLIKNYLETKSK